MDQDLAEFPCHLTFTLFFGHNYINVTRAQCVLVQARLELRVPGSLGRSAACRFAFGIPFSVNISHGIFGVYHGDTSAECIHSASIPEMSVWSGLICFEADQFGRAPCGGATCPALRFPAESHVLADAAMIRRSLPAVQISEFDRCARRLPCDLAMMGRILRRSLSEFHDQFR
jgi:hypothetical protein